jgi:DNA polymerase-3 subunit epsilon
MKTEKFTAIDFETANGSRTTICQVGLVVYENGIIINEINLLVQPPENFYWDRFIDIHGITPAMTANEPTFDKVWHLIEPFITNQNVVAHNGICFDFPVLEKTLAYYNLQAPEYNKLDTRKIYRGGLKDLCIKHKIPLNHHDALSDAKACGELYLRYLNGRNK